MIIHSLKVSHLRGIDHAELTSIPATGVLLISGANEAGKSTLLDAIDVVLREKHGSRKQAMQAMQSNTSDEPPEIELEATVGPQRFRIVKRFLRSPKATYTPLEPSGKALHGREADDALAQLLEEHLDDDLLHALFVRQNKLDNALDAVGIGSVEQALERASGVKAGQASRSTGSDETGLLAAVDKEFGRYFTKTGRPSGELKDAQAAHEQAQLTLDSAREQARKLQDYVTDVESTTAEIANAEAQIPQLETNRAAAEKHAAEARQIAQRRATSQAEYNTAQAQLDLVKQQRQQREKLQATLSAATAGLTAAADEWEEIQQQAVAYDEQLAAARTAQREASAAVDTQKENASAMRRRFQVAQACASQSTLRQQLDAFTAAETALDEAKRKRKGFSIGSDTLAEANELQAQVRQAEAVLKAVAARVSVANAGSTPQTVRIDAEQVEVADTAIERIVSVATEVAVGDITVTIAPGQDSAKATNDVEYARQQLEDFLADYDVANIEQLQEVHTQFIQATEDVAARTQEFEQAQRDCDPKAHAAQIAEYASLLEAEPELAAGFGESVDAAQLRQCETAVEEADAALEQARMDADAAHRTVSDLLESPLTAKVARAKERHALAEKSVEEAQQALASFDANSDAAALDAAFEKAETAVRVARKNLDEVEQAFVAADPEQAELLFEGAKAAIEANAQQLSLAQQRLSSLASYIDALRGADEELSRAEAELERATYVLETTQRRSHAVEVLRESLLRHRNAVRATYAQPFAQRLNQLSKSVFGPGAEVILDENLRLAGRSGDNGIVELDYLSTGAQEQLAMLQRMAIASLVADDCKVPVFLDDTLGNSDPDRLAKMAVQISQLGKSHQVFVLTCTPSRFASVVGAQHVSMQQLKTAGQP